MQWSMIVAVIGCLVVGVACLPVEVPESPALELMPPKVDDGLPTLATDLVPPPLPEETTKITEDDKALETRQAEEKIHATLFLINVYAVKNQTAEDANDVLHDDVIGEVPEIAEPLAMFLLVVEDEDEHHPVSLDEIARDLEEEGFSIEKVEKDGETRIVKVDLGSVETLMKIPNTHDSDKDAKSTVSDKVESNVELIDNEEPALEESNKLMKIRRKRHICMKCQLRKIKAKYSKGGGGCGGGCGRSYQPAPVIRQPVIVPVVIVPVRVGYYRPPQQQHYHPPPQQYHPNSCNVCNGGGGGGYGGGGNSYAQASASAQASGSSYG